jgi:hypothetical protein
MQKIREIKEINEGLIRSWKTPNREQILASENSEEKFLLAYENGLYETPSEPKLNPREMIYVLTTQKSLSPSLLSEVKAMTRSWLDMTSKTWNENVLPLYSVELEYILLRL